MEYDLNFWANGRRPILFEKWKRTSTFGQNGRRPQFQGKWKTSSILRKMEDNLNFEENGRLLHLLGKWILRKMKANLIFRVKGRQPIFCFVYGR